ncbi:MAG TPA: hypothetical protein DEF42_13510 [Desulfosporosinus sp.]|nr:hypothetical protein [Desulfosporosinus sp.]
MNCNYHPHQEAQAICVKCKNPICLECTVKINDKTACRQCLEENLSSNQVSALPTSLPRKTFLEKLLFLCFSLIPGAAHMHQGLFRRGLQLMIITFGGIALINFIGLDFLIPFIVIPAWFFSFFESHHLRRQVEKGQTIVDQDLFNHQMFDYTPLLKNPRAIGYTIIVIGILSLLRQIDRYSFLPRLIGNWDYYNFLRASFIPFLLILGGIYLIIKATRTQPTKGKSEIAEND